MNHSLVPLIAILLLAGTAYAESGQDNKSRREHRGPPDAALEACSTLVQGDPCAFEGQRGDTLEGTCEAPDDKPLACRPQGDPPTKRLERN